MATNLLITQEVVKDRQLPTYIYIYNLTIKNNIVDLSTAQTLTGKTLTTPIINAISNGGQSITVPSGISSIFALQSAGAQTAGNICTYFNTSPTPAVIQ